MLTPEEFDAALAKMPAEELVVLKYEYLRRPEQTPPDPLPDIWLCLGGRGSGKTWTASNHIFAWCKNLPWTAKNKTIRVALVGEVLADVKKTMIEGDTGLKSLIPEELVVLDNRSMGEFH